MTEIAIIANEFCFIFKLYYPTTLIIIIIVWRNYDSIRFQYIVGTQFALADL